MHAQTTLMVSMVSSRHPPPAPPPPPPPPFQAPREPFEALVERHQAEIERFIRRHTGAGAGPAGGGFADVADLCQETFLRALRAYDRVGPETHARAWLYRIAANVCTDHWRRHGRQPPTATLTDLTPAAAPDDSPEAALLAREDAERVRAAIAQLPPRQRRALELRRLHGLSYAEVARLMGGSAETARANVYQALRRLQSLWAASLAPEEHTP
jgi:RNA polymerase sigma-70 factor (ECF subfamily)